jgi:hypothetical protein
MSHSMSSSLEDLWWLDFRPLYCKPLPSITQLHLNKDPSAYRYNHNHISSARAHQPSPDSILHCSNANPVRYRTLCPHILRIFGCFILGPCSFQPIIPTCQMLLRQIKYTQYSCKCTNTSILAFFYFNTPNVTLSNHILSVLL